MRSITHNVAFPPSLLAELREAAARENVSLGALVRRAVKWEPRRLELARSDEGAHTRNSARSATAGASM